MVSTAAKTFIDTIRNANRADTAPFDLETERFNANGAGAATEEAPGVVQKTVELEGIRTLCLTPEKHLPDRQMLFMHGGAFAMMSPESHERFAGHVANACRTQTFLPDYSLAPENPFPTGMNETIAMLKHLIEHGQKAGKRTILLGESSGGAFALGAAQTLRDQNGPLPACIVLICPWLDLSLSGASIDSNAQKAAILSKGNLTIFADYYMNDLAIPKTAPLVSPLFGSLANLPPIYCQAGEFDLLLDDATRLMGRDGRNVTVEVFPDMCHSFQFFAGKFPEADAAIKMIGDFVDFRLLN